MDSAAINRDIAAISRISAVPSILKVVAELTGMRVTLVARVTSDNWTACAVYDHMEFGLRVGDQLEVATTLCKEVHDNEKAIVIEHATKDPFYCNHRTPKLYSIESYIAIPIHRSDGRPFGTLCAIDRLPAKLEPRVISSLTLFSELIASQLRAEEERQELEQNLWDERKISHLREQFIAVLGHDLRAPLGGISGSADVLLEMAPTADQLSMLRGIKESSEQMSQLINDVLDFARGRLGGGLTITKKIFPEVGQLIRQTIDELSRTHRSRSVRFDASKPVAGWFDAVRFRQLLANLLGNALQYSPPHEAVSVQLDEVGGMTRLAVNNGGPPIPPEKMANLFVPFNRPAGAKQREGLGLGLYISSEIARAHGGSIHAESDERGTVFTVLIPGPDAA